MACENAALRGALQRLARPLLHAERIVIEEMDLDVEAPLPRITKRCCSLLRKDQAGVRTASLA